MDEQWYLDFFLKKKYYPHDLVWLLQHNQDLYHIWQPVQEQPAEMADCLPEEIVINILLRLPVQTLLRCTAVRKSWYSLITTPEFISSHLKLAAANNDEAPLLLIRRRIRNSERYELYSDSEESFSRLSKLEFPFRSTNSFFTIVGSCNGLLCFYDDRVDYTDTIILWNPCIKKSTLLPKPNQIHSSILTFAQSFGFGFDGVGSDYKVVRITYVDNFNPQVELYKLSTGVWQDMSYLRFECVIDSRSRSAYINGATHWIARCYTDSYDLIVLFDVSQEVFAEIVLPIDLVKNDPTTSVDLMVYMETLALVLCNVSEVEPSLCVWVMNEYGVEESWSKHFNFDFCDIGGIFIRPLWIRKRGGVITVLQDGELYSYDPNEEEVKDLGVGGAGYEYYGHSIHVDSHIQSLVLLERGPYFSDAETCNRLPTYQTYNSDSIKSCESD